MKKNLITLLILLLLPLTISAQAVGGEITRKKPNTTTPAPTKKKPQNVQQKRTAQQRSEAQKRAERERIAQAQAERERQEQEAREQAAKEAERSRILQNLISNMVYVEGSTFRMGNKDKHAQDDEKPVHQVTLSSFSIGRYEVTQEEWQAVMGSNPSRFEGSKRPVENVCWDDCQEFIRKLNAMTGKQFRLPSEAEWEYAARGGNRSRGYKYAGSNDLSSVAWHDDNSGGQRHEVGSKQPNELGLYDISGNVWEWCQDWYGGYSSSSQTNPTGPSSGSYRVIRGGSWINNARSCRVSFRISSPDFRNFNLGLRLAQ